MVLYNETYLVENLKPKTMSYIRRTFSSDGKYVLLSSYSTYSC